jgi:hypothetical protein
MLKSKLVLLSTVYFGTMQYQCQLILEQELVKNAKQ